MCSKGPECRVMLRHCLAIIIRKEGCQGDPGDFWMYESGYLLFQGLLAANSVCWWNAALQGATKNLVFRGYISPGALVVSAEPCALEVLRGAWARRVLQPPAGYHVVAIEDIEECIVSSVGQTQWTPLPEAVCAVVLRLSSQGRPAGLATIREALILAFPHVSPPGERALYDTLVQLTAERKLYHTSKGYFIVTPERRRSRSHSRGRKRNDEVGNTKSMLLSTEEALVFVHGEMATIRDGDVTHQCVQTNLADVICGGNPSDKILYARNHKRRSASFPAPRSPDRRGSFRLWSSARRLRRSASTRTLARHCTDSSSSTEYPNSSDSAQTPKKESLLSRIFRRSKRSQCQISTFSAQFPPTEWFNSKAVHLHNVATQTAAADKSSAISVHYSCGNSEISSARSATLPRRHRRQLSNDDSTYVTSYLESRDHSPSLRYGSPSHASSTLPRNSTIIRSPLHSAKSRESSRKTSRSSLSTKATASNNDIENEDKQKSSVDVPIKREPLRLANQQEPFKSSSLESLKTSHNRTIQGKTLHTLETDFNDYESSVNDQSAINKSLRDLPSSLKNSLSLDNSGPSSIESHKSSKTGSSLTSGPSSLESHRTVIAKPIEAQKPIKRSPKRKEVSKAKPLKSPNGKTIPHSNSFTLQVTTNQGNVHNANSNTTATINSGNGANTKIYVQNSPVRSVITFENGQGRDPNPNVVIINGSAEPIVEEKKYPNEIKLNEQKYQKNTNSSAQTREENLNNSRDHLSNDVNKSELNKNETMNNSRKLSLQLSPKESFSYRNLIKNMPSSSYNQFSSNPGSPVIDAYHDFTKNSFASNPPSPTKSYDNIGGSVGNVCANNDLKISHKYCLSEKNLLGSEPNICYKEQDNDKTLLRENSRDHQFPSLSDLSFNFTSLAAQKILKGVSINSIDTLVELNIAATNEKQNNCDVIHTDFGLV